ncbi:HNH endonuclease signature motif containing protein [Nesterenkonia rhizosphaerae]|uniref:HNH nuclease domain-containing protein n=1 Tax=Nesterenkonia rhizosphaerae TaxID=1348272 RepID=A0ABP9G555_9MICC
MAASTTSSANSAPPMPEHLRTLAGEPELAAAWEQQVASRRAEAAKITALMEYRQRTAASYTQEPLVTRSEADRAAVHDAARILGVSDRTATTVLNTAQEARHFLPRTWRAFTEGLIDLPRVRKTVDAATTSDLPADLLQQLDQAAAEQAQRCSLSEFHHWLTRYTASLDPEAYARACEKASQDRFMRFQHLSQGMSYLQAYIPTLEAAAIEKRLKAAARGMDQPSFDQPNGDQPIPGGDTAADRCQASPGSAETGDAGQGRAETSTMESGAAGRHTADAQSSDSSTTHHHGAGPRTTRSSASDARAADPSTTNPDASDPGASDPRTLAQRVADLFTAWLRDGRVYDAAVDAKIMIMIPEATLTGDSDEPAMAADRSWMIPAHQARHVAADPEANHHWYQGRSRKDSRNAEYDLLSARYIGRYPPEHLRDALIFRDGTCQADGCTISAERCDIDHQTPWEHGGETTADNLWALCRRHHRMKSHGFLHPPPRDSEQDSSPNRSQHRPTPGAEHSHANRTHWPSSQPSGAHSPSAPSRSAHSRCAGSPSTHSPSAHSQTERWLSERVLSDHRPDGRQSAGYTSAEDTPPAGLLTAADLMWRAAPVQYDLAA